MHTVPRPERRFMQVSVVLLAAGIAFGGLLAPTIGHAQYPSRPIRLMVTVAPGGGPDTIARVIAERLSPLLGQPVVVENRAGSNGNIAMDLVAKSAPDGYTMVICADSMIVINPQIYAKMPLDTLKDLTPIASVASNTFFLSVHPSVPVKNFQEFIAYAKTANPPLAYASSGNGSQHQMAMEMLKLRAEINRVLPMPEVKQRLNAAGGLEPYATTPQEFAERIRSDYEKYGKLVKQIKVKVD